MPYVLEDIMNGSLILTTETAMIYYASLREEFTNLKDLVNYISDIEDANNKLLMIEAFANYEAHLSISCEETGILSNLKPVASNTSTVLYCNAEFPSLLAQLLTSISSLKGPNTERKIVKFLRNFSRYNIIGFFPNSQASKNASHNSACYGYLDTVADIPIDWDGIKSLINNPLDKRVIDKMIEDYNLTSITQAKLTVTNL